MLSCQSLKSRMVRCTSFPLPLHGLLLLGMLFAFARASAQSIGLHGESRPMPGSIDVPVRTSFFLQVWGASAENPVAEESIGVRLEPAGGEAVALLEPGGKFAAGATGSVAKSSIQFQGSAYAVNVDTPDPLLPATTYTLTVSARLKSGAALAPSAGSFRFMTEAEETTRTVAFDLDLRAKPVQWHGSFFSGIMQPSFMLGFYNLKETFEMMAEAHKIAPKAWLIQRDWFITGSDFRPGYGFGGPRPANIVREMETRHIRSIEKEGDGARLFVEDFIGHELYGIPSSRTLSLDYEKGHEVLIADGIISTRTLVREVRDADGSVLVDNPAIAEMPWQLDYASVPEENPPDAPGRIAVGGGYLRRFNPVGTVRYYWGRWDLFADAMVNQYGRKRFVINPIEAPGDLAAYGKFDSPPKDYPQYHAVMREITSHIIDRYGDKTLDFIWSVFNETDLAHGPMGWQNWIEVQRFYDYTVDAILRAFEDHGYDSEKVHIGGLELGAVFGLNLRDYDFLAHCSPNYTTTARPELLPYNAAYADKRLDGKRSRRVERLCGASGGKGSPCDFLSVHTYNYADIAAAKILRIKETALSIDPEYYADLYANTFEACLTWSSSPDKAVPVSFMNNGYFSGWCADVTARLLRKASEDPRFAYGDSVVTTWYEPTMNLSGLNGISRAFDVDDDGDGSKDRRVTVPEQVFHFLTLLNTMGETYWPLPEQIVGQHGVSGFASPTSDSLRVVLYSHSMRDPENRSEKSFAINLAIHGAPWQTAAVEQYQFDEENNSTYRQLLALQKAKDAAQTETMDPVEMKVIVADLKSGDPDRQIDAFRKIQKAGPRARAAVETMQSIAETITDENLKREGMLAYVSIVGQNQGFPAKAIEEIVEKSALRPTRVVSAEFLESEGALNLTVPVASNGINFLIIRPDMMALPPPAASE